MNDTVAHKFLKALRYIYIRALRKEKKHDGNVSSIDDVGAYIYDILSSGKPCMIARYGYTELDAVCNYLGVRSGKKDVIGFIKGEPKQWWWSQYVIEHMRMWTGFFPATPDMLSKFGELMLEDSKQLDVIGSWRESEQYVCPENVKKVRLSLLEPWLSRNPWSRVLEGKRVLVIHPFATTIKQQYARREKLFKNQLVLPQFKSLRVIPAVQSIGGGAAGFKSWFDALEWMKSEMDKEAYDVALIGCGAYGFPLAAHAKRTGHQAVHLGGALQLMFGIRGKRWDDKIVHGGERYGIPEDAYTSMYNEYWVRPSSEETPTTANQVEGGCYW
jgi:hypothetical protein